MELIIAVVVHLDSAHPFLVSLWRAFHRRLILVRRKLRQLAQERHDVPKELVAMRHAPGRHARRLYPVLHNPKFLGMCQLASAMELGRSRIEAPADFGS